MKILAAACLLMLPARVLHAALEDADLSQEDGMVSLWDGESGGTEELERGRGRLAYGWSGKWGEPARRSESARGREPAPSREKIRLDWASMEGRWELAGGSSRHKRLAAGPATGGALSARPLDSWSWNSGGLAGSFSVGSATWRTLAGDFVPGFFSGGPARRPELDRRISDAPALWAQSDRRRSPGLRGIAFSNESPGSAAEAWVSRAEAPAERRVMLADPGDGDSFRIRLVQGFWTVEEEGGGWEKRFGSGHAGLWVVHGRLQGLEPVAGALDGEFWTPGFTAGREWPDGGLELSGSRRWDNGGREGDRDFLSLSASQKFGGENSAAFSFRHSGSGFYGPPGPFFEGDFLREGVFQLRAQVPSAAEAVVEYRRQLRRIRGLDFEPQRAGLSVQWRVAEDLRLRWTQSYSDIGSVRVTRSALPDGVASRLSVSVSDEHRAGFFALWRPHRATWSRAGLEWRRRSNGAGPARDGAAVSLSAGLQVFERWGVSVSARLSDSDLGRPLTETETFSAGLERTVRRGVRLRALWADRSRTGEETVLDRGVEVTSLNPGSENRLSLEAELVW